MNVFILCTGRCGSTTLAEAFKHVINYSSAHESNWGRLGDRRVMYPDNHIEVDNRLAWCLGRLDKQYGKNAFYIHLTRDREKTALSFLRRFGLSTSIIRAYADSIVSTPERSIEACRDYVDCVNENIKMFLRDKPHQMEMQLESLEEQFPMFWDRIKAQGDLRSALKTIRDVHNPSSTCLPEHRSRANAAIRRLKGLLRSS